MKTLDELMLGKVQTTINALRIAADVYSADAERAFNAGEDRIGRQFRYQQGEVIELADALEELP